MARGVLCLSDKPTRLTQAGQTQVSAAGSVAPGVSIFRSDRPRVFIPQVSPLSLALPRTVRSSRSMEASAGRPRVVPTATTCDGPRRVSCSPSATCGGPGHVSCSPSAACDSRARSAAARRRRAPAAASASPVDDPGRSLSTRPCSRSPSATCGGWRYVSCSPSAACGSRARSATARRRRAATAASATSRRRPGALGANPAMLAQQC
jgi:hypothetical protein